MLNRKAIFQIAVAITSFLGVLTHNAAATEIVPSPFNPSGNTITISTSDITSYAAPYENSGDITITNGGKLTNYDEFTNLSGTFSINSGGRLANNGVFTVDFIALLKNDGIIDNNKSFKNSWDFYNNPTGVFNNAFSAGLTNTQTMNNSGSVVNAGNFLNNYDRLSLTVATLQNSGNWTNTAGSSFTNYGTVLSFDTINNSGHMINTILGSGGYGQGTFDHHGILNNLAGGVVDNEQRWFNRLVTGPGTSPSVINNSGVFNNGRFGIGGMGNDGIINNLAGGTFNNAGSLANNSQINNAGNFIINVGSSVNAGSGIVGTYTQTAGLTNVNGNLAGSVINIQGGTLNGSGTISGPVLLGTAAALNPGNSPGTLTINGNLTSNGKMIFEIGGLGAGQFDELKINGAALFTGGTLEFDFINGFSAVAGNSWDFLFANSYSGQNTLNYTFNGLAPGLRGVVSFNTNHWNLSVTSVPVPAAVWLFGSGLLGLLGVARCRAA